MRTTNREKRYSTLAIVASFRLEVARGSIARRENGGQADRRGGGGKGEGEKKKKRETRRMHVRVCIVHDLDCNGRDENKSFGLCASLCSLARSREQASGESSSRDSRLNAEIAPSDFSPASCAAPFHHPLLPSFDPLFSPAFFHSPSQLRSKIFAHSRIKLLGETTRRNSEWKISKVRTSLFVNSWTIRKF